MDYRNHGKYSYNTVEAQRERLRCLLIRKAEFRKAFIEKMTLDTSEK